MNRRFFLKGVATALPLASSMNVPVSFGSTDSRFELTHFSIPSAGRCGFYVDYSELDDVGVHKFYVARTHGCNGEVSVEYRSYGDPHTNVNGILRWADGDCGIKEITVPVISKQNGEHRIYLALSSPQGGLDLHMGDYTIAYGVIDDGTVSDSGIFYDSDAPDGGDGSMSKPFNNIYVALQNVDGNKFLYGRGVTIPDGTNTANPNGGGGIVNCINFPDSRSGEEDRLYIRNWPGHEWRVSGGSNNDIGFYSDGGRSFITFKGIRFSSLKAWPGVSGKYSEGGGISNFKSSAESINVENCEFIDIDGSTNTAGFNPYLISGSKVWKCIFDTIAVNGNTSNLNSSGVLTYSGKYISVQRSEFKNCHSGVYQKRVSQVGDVSPSVRFNVFNSEVGLLLGTAGGGNSHSYSIAQSNAFVECKVGIDHNNTFQTDQVQGLHWWTNNVFDRCGGGEIAAVTFKYAFEVVLYNNIMLDCRKVWAEVKDCSSISPVGVRYANFNHEFGTTLKSQTYEWRSINFSSANAAFDATGLARDDSTGDPIFKDPAAGDYRLGTLSPCIGSGLSGSDKGIFLTGVEQLGVSDSSSRPMFPPNFGAS